MTRRGYWEHKSYYVREAVEFIAVFVDILV